MNPFICPASGSKRDILLQNRTKCRFNLSLNGYNPAGLALPPGKRGTIIFNCNPYVFI